MHPIEVVAHRGASAHAPEHTFQAYDLALELGADALELDLRSTADGRLVVLHDPTLERTTGDPRPIARVPARELAGPRRPLGLDEVLDRYGRNAGWLLELKDPQPSVEDALVRALHAHGLARRATVQSFDHCALRRVRRLDSGMAVAPLMCESWSAAQIRLAARRCRTYAGGIGVLHASLDAALAAAVRASGLRLRAYTVNEPAEMRRLIALGVDGLITDAPDRARLALSTARELAAA